MATTQQSTQLAQWNAWESRQRPRPVRLKYRFWSALVLVIFIAVPSLLLAALIMEWRASRVTQAMNPNLWSSIPFILLPLVFLALAFSISIRDKRLVREGEISIGKVIDVRRGRRGTVTYEFLDRSGRVVTASSPDNTRQISAGMAIPVFYKIENPQRHQIALCGSFYEVADSSDALSAATSKRRYR